MAFVVVQHLSPDFDSMMDELLARHTKLAIHKVEEGMEVKPNCIYLIPPKKEMVIANGRLRLTDKDPKQALTLPIDVFFRSLAHDTGARAVAVVLSGTGSDGSRGICDIHRAGGLVLAQSEDSAKFDGMPRAAIDTGVVDLDLPVEDIPGAILQHVRRTFGGPDVIDGTNEAGNRFFDIFKLLKREYGIDFRHYKIATVQRRIERRLSMGSESTVRGYAKLLAKDSSELNALYRDLLIGVTRFFRDAEAFQRLETEFLRPRLMNADEDDEIRIWVAACATGEEAYSIAILADEILRSLDRQVTVKIFATDVHRTSLDFAGRGIYPETALADVSSARLERYFKPHGNEYQINKSLRQLIVFAPQNLIRDAPFTKLDLVTCRNMLIYLEVHAQQRAISLMHFGLKTDGVLFLGPSETPGQLENEFEPIDRHWRMYRKKRDVRLATGLRVPLGGTGGLHTSEQRKEPRPLTDAGILRAYDAVLTKFMPPGFMIDQNRRLVHSFGGAGRFIRVQDGRVSSDFLDQVCEDLRLVLSGAMARNVDEPATFRNVQIRTPNDAQFYVVTVQRIEHGGLETPFTLITLETQAGENDASHDSSHIANSDNYDLSETSRSRIAELESELGYTRQNLQATNEEMVASNEELQSTNEELHSVNEELYTVNAEHQRKIGELTELTDDMENLLSSIDVGTVFVDRDLCIRKFTPRIADSFHLVGQDIGRRIDDFANTLNRPGLVDEIESVVRSSQPIEAEFQNSSGVWYLMRIQPYRSRGVTEGAVLSLIETGLIKEAEEETREAEAKYADLYEKAPDMYVSIDTQTRRIVECNQTTCDRLGFSRDELIGHNVLEVYHVDCRHAAQTAFEEFCETGEIRGVELQLIGREGQVIEVSLNASAVRDDSGKIVRSRSVWRDISQLVGARNTLIKREARISLLLDSAAEGIYGIDLNGNCTFCNPACLELLGYQSADQLIGKSMHDLIHYKHADGTPYVMGDCRIYHAVRTSERNHVTDEVLWRNDGTSFPTEYWSYPIHHDGELVGAVVTFLDISERHAHEVAIRDAIDRRDQFLAMLSHELRTPLHATLNAVRVMERCPDDPESLSRSHDVIQRQSSQMSHLLDDLLDVSRITQGRIELRKRPLVLLDVVQPAVDALELIMSGRHQSLSVSNYDEPLWVIGDAARLQQIIVNLLNNASKYSPDDSKIELELTKEANEAVIRVHDSGAGIASDRLESIFELFVQNDQTLDRAGGGMGIGLTLVRSLVGLHGGSVRAMSEGTGYGSTFEVRLPLVPPPLRDKALTDNRKDGQRTLVLVEDDADSREMLVRLLELDGHAIHTAEDGHSGVNQIIKVQPDVALVDVGLPGIDGYEVARRVREQLGPDTVLLIAVTGYGQDSDRKQALDAGFDDHLVKPIDPDTLQLMISSHGRRM
ncbi:UNVERIFIED_CONTAM: hypothetical protein GTU68_032167 [Idotea baltica]|nr:hypothetical protein [Idotea baltica]